MVIGKECIAIDSGCRPVDVRDFGSFDDFGSFPFYFLGGLYLVFSH
jgi:hypothetical protein